MIANGKRQLKSGKRYDHLIPKPNFQNTKLSDLIEVGFTVKSMKNIVRATHTDVTKLAQVLKGQTITETCSNIFHFVYNHIQYVKDKTGIEEIRTPARIWADRKGDCDCYSTLIGAILYSLKIPFAFRITKYSLDWQHVYIIVYNQNAPNRKELKTFLDEETGEEYEKVVRTNKPKGYNIIDPVVDDDDYEVEFTDKQDHKMSTLMLSGIDDDVIDDYGTTTVEEDLGDLGRRKRRRRKKRRAKRKKKKKRGGLLNRFRKKRKARRSKRKKKKAAKRTARSARIGLTKKSLNDLITAYKTNRSVLKDKTRQAVFKQFLARAKRDKSYKAELQRISTSTQTRKIWESILKDYTFKKIYNEYKKNTDSTATKGKKRGLFKRFRRKKRGRKKKKRGGIFNRLRRKNKGKKKRGGIFSKLKNKIKERKKKRKVRRKKKRADKAKNGKTNFLQRWKNRRKKRRNTKRIKRDAKRQVKNTKKQTPVVTRDKINPIKIDHQNDIVTDDFNLDDFDTDSTNTTSKGGAGKNWFEDDGETWNSEGDWGADSPEVTTQKNDTSTSEEKENDIFFDTSEIEKGIDDDLDFDMQQSSKEVEAATKNLTKNLPMLKDDFAAIIDDEDGLLDEGDDFADAKFDELDEFDGEEPKEPNIFQKGIEWAKENPKAATGVAIGTTVIIGGTVYFLTRPKKPTSFQPYKPRSRGKKGKKSLNGTASFAGFQ
ncbi:transglutaminase-like domain-containing protein [Bernardetia sp. ABR2-2B]|uniref:transglutaminase-like domain-containing protein n=1 Tax=Bernardetia sp. ABR2-2B TaxID=3127472 RepID=UPI0030D0C278